MIIDAAVVDIDGAQQNILEISKKDFEDLLIVNRQELGNFPEIFPDDDERNRMITAVGPLLLELCRGGKYGQFVTLFPKFLIREDAFSVSFLPPLTMHLRPSRPGEGKRIFNSNFQNTFKYFALYFGGAAMKKTAQTNWVENLRAKYNVKVQNYNSSKKGYTQDNNLNPCFTVETAFVPIVSFYFTIFA